jgi:hypothetical protein
MLGRAAAHRDARALGDMMLAVARLRESHLSGHTLIEDAEHALSLAIELVADVRPSHRVRRAKRVEQCALDAR